MCDTAKMKIFNFFIQKHLSESIRNLHKYTKDRIKSWSRNTLSLGEFAHEELFCILMLSEGVCYKVVSVHYYLILPIYFISATELNFLNDPRVKHFSQEPVNVSLNYSPIRKTTNGMD